MLLDRNVEMSVRASTCNFNDFNASTQVVWKLWRCDFLRSSQKWVIGWCLFQSS